MTTYYQNKTALITGGSSGIGLALARSLAARGSNVWILARNQEKLSEAIQSIQNQAASKDQRFGMIPADVSDYSQVEAAVKQMSREIGVPNLLINSAGITYPGYIQDLELEIFRSMMETNYFGTLYVIKAALPGMISRGSGHIINISSSAGAFGLFGYSAYAPSKFAVSGLSEVLRAEMKSHGIRVTVVFPSDVDTPQLAFENKFKPFETKAIAGNEKLLTPEGVAETILTGAARGKFAIVPGTMNALAYHANHISKGLLFRVFDWMAADAQRKFRRDNQHRLVKP